MNITVTDTALLTPTGGIASNTPIKIVCLEGYDQVLTGAISEFTTDDAGAYSFPLYYGTFAIMIRFGSTYTNLGKAVINSESLSNVNIATVLSYTEPLTPAEIQLIIDLTEEATTAASEAETSATEAAASASSASNSATQASEISGLDDVAGAIALTNTDVAFEATFNDSLNISKGYGTHDTITVASETVDLPSKSVDFTCASERNIINKSGLMELVGVNEPGFDLNGLVLHGAYSNVAIWSEDFTNSRWSKRVGSSVEATTEVDSPIISGAVTKHYSTSTDQDGTFIRYNNVGFDDNGIYTAQMIVKKGTSDTAKIIIYALESTTDKLEVELNFNTGAVTETAFGDITDYMSGVTVMQDGWFMLWASSNVLTGTSTVGVDFIPSNWGVPSSAGSEYGYIACAQITKSGSPLPYVKTESTAVSVAKTSATTITNGNLPAPGMPFAISAEVRFSKGDSTNSWAYFVSDYITLRTDANRSSILARVFNDGETATPANGVPLDGPSLIVLRYDGDNCTMFADGVEYSTFIAGAVPAGFTSNDLYIGKYDGGQEGGVKIKNLRVHHGLVSDDTIKSWGAAV